jgi:hypothetical protein
VTFIFLQGSIVLVVLRFNYLSSNDVAHEDLPEWATFSYIDFGWGFTDTYGNLKDIEDIEFL